MKVLKFGNSETEKIIAEKIVKTDTDIIGYTNNIEVFAFRGITDFRMFMVTDEQGNVTDYDIEESNTQDKIINDFKAQLEATNQAIAELSMMITAP